MFDVNTPLTDLGERADTADPKVMNLQRAEAGRQALAAFPWVSQNDPETAISDLIGDLCHLADLVDPGAGWGTLRRAERHYVEECEEVLDDAPVAA